ncbi:hypothetical protein D0859_07777 [Hortaea werneckii]|uniref:Uncharacterized protein n=1 Tax=Hortaea werneckii TaxID=91943 RepID=A0A3M7IRJ6_HORWE|nr:hypothetical protein D0859_07777 [Hortaea werneckii]
MTLDYKRFRTAQLARFARNRNLDVEVRPRQERGCYLRALIDADNDATFRFFDLPAEMRNTVYEHLLTLRDLNHGWRCYPEILATCKQVNREARGYLMTGNRSKIHAVLNLTLSNPYSRPPYLEQYIYANGQQLNSGGSLVFHWPSVLLDSQHIDISIAIQQGPRFYHTRWPFGAHCADIVVNRAMYDLYYALQDRGRKPSVNFTIYVSPGGAKIPNSALLLSPIAMFDGPKSFELSKFHRRKRRAIKSSATAKLEHSCNGDQVKRCIDVSKAIWEMDSLRSSLRFSRIREDACFEQCHRILNEAGGLMTIARERRLSSAIDDLEAQINNNEARLQQMIEENRAMAKDWANRIGKA